MKILEKHYQKLFRLEEKDFRLKALMDLILDLIPKEKSLILDLGCGSALFSCLLAKKDHKVVAIDLSPKMIGLAEKRKKMKGIKDDQLILLKMKAEEIKNLDKKFDIILILDVLEHLKNDQEVLASLKKILKNNGRLIMTVPAHPYFYGKRDKEMGHYRRYSKKCLRKLLDSAGYTINKMCYWNFLGFFVYYFNEKIMRKKINEEIRYKQDKRSQIIKKTIYQLLKLEKIIYPPIGLSLLVVCHQ